MINKCFLPLLTVSLLLMGGCAQMAKKNMGDMDDMIDESSTVDFDVNDDSDSSDLGPIQTVHFAFNSSALSRTSKMKLKRTASFLSNNESVELQIEGHCDERGGVQYNLALGERRARIVKQYLVSLGVTSRRLTTISYGKEKPVSSGSDEDSWKQNRRANFMATAN